MKYLCLLLISLPAFGQFGAASRILSGTGAPVAAQCTVENNVGLVWARKDGADVGTTFYVCGATGVGTYGWELRGGAPGGGAALSTPGSVPFVTAAGVLGQSASQFRWDIANSRFLVGAGTPAFSSKMYVIGDGALNPYQLALSNAGQAALFLSGTTFAQIYNGGSGDLFITNSAAAGHLIFRTNEVEGMRLASTSRNLLLGTTTDDGTNRLQVAGNMAATGVVRSTQAGRAQLSGSNSRGSLELTDSAGANGLNTYFNGSVWKYESANNMIVNIPTVQFQDERATIGSTSLVVRAGAGQTGNLFSVRNASNVEQFWVNAFGPEANNFIAVTRFRTNSNEVGIEAMSGLDLASNRLIRYSSTTDYSGTKDLSLSRAAANTLQVGDGSANSNGTILARIHTWANGTEGTCDATLRGQVVMVQGGAGVADTLRVCRKDAADAYAWTALY